MIVIHKDQQVLEDVLSLKNYILEVRQTDIQTDRCVTPGQVLCAF